MNLADKIVLAHKGYFNKECEESYRENSREVCAISGSKDYINIIELDVRKSRDGILYCYHGTFFEYYFDLKFPKDFSIIRSKYNVNSLEEILEVIPENKIVFLDIKDCLITKQDLIVIFSRKKFKEVILGNRSVSFLERFNEMPKEFVKMLNGNIFCNFYDLEKLKRDNFKYFEVVFPFQVNERIVEQVEKNNMEFRCAGLLFMNKESYWKKINRYAIKHISSDFI